MKKLIIIIVILAIILVGMFIYNRVSKKTDNIPIQEIEKIENYIDQIYMWKEITGDALPLFEDINKANERWLWEVVKKNMEDDVLSYEQIQEKAKELFGPNFTKKFPKGGTEYLRYNEKTNEYESIDVELDQQGDLFLLNTINKTKEGYEIEVIEYLEDNAPMLQEEAKDYIIIRNLKEEEIGKITGSAEEEETNLVKENIDKFSRKKIRIKQEGEKLYIDKVFEP